MAWDEGVYISADVDYTKVVATRIIRCAWKDWVANTNIILGGSTAVAGTTLFIRGMPFPDSPNLFASHVDIKGVDSAGRELVPMVGTNMIAYDTARLYISHTIPQFNFGKTTGSQELDFSSTAFCLDPNKPSFKWTVSGKSLPPALIPVVRLTTVTLTQTAYNVAVLPVNTIIGLLDCVNSGSFMGAPAKQILFKGARAVRKIALSGAENWDITYCFELNRRGWNTLFNPAGSDWEAFTKNNGDDLYDPEDLTVLLPS